MCGICGELRTDGGVADAAAVSKMTASLSHRGPDDHATYGCGPVALGHRRLSIIDLSANGRQPMWTVDRSMAIVFNGEVYNFAEIARELRTRGYVFQSGTDTEVALNAVHCWGVRDAVCRFIGMFAFAVWDSRRRALTLCRDRAGIKPLYYYAGSHGVLFASEMRGLYAHPTFPRELNHDGLAQYFVLGYSAGELTVFRDTFRVPAGHFLTFASDGSASRQRYWSLDDTERGSFTGTFEQATEQLEELCHSAFAYRLVSDVPVGMFLSGGIDSTLVAAVLRKRLDADLLHLTIGFGQPAFDEAPKATSVAKQLGLRHIVRYLDVPDASEMLHRFVATYDEPFADTSGIPTRLVSEVAREHVKVALSGDGGDEQFWGYDSYASYSETFARLRRIPVPLRRLAGAAMARAVPYELLLSATLAAVSSDSARPQVIARYEKLIALLGVRSPVDLLRVMNEKAWTRGDVGGLLRTAASAALDASVLGVSGIRLDPDHLADAMMRMDYTLFLRDDILTKVDRASMSVSLECRDPLLDHRIAEFAFSLPLDYLCSHGQQKRILKQVLRPWIDDRMLNAPKAGFSIPLYRWMRGPWKPLVEEYLSPANVRAIGVLDPAAVSNEVRRFYRYAGCRAEKIFTMLNFQMWAERWLRSAP